MPPETIDQSESVKTQSRQFPRALIAVVAISLAYLYVTLARFGLTVIAPDVTADFGLGPAELGMLGAVTMWGYAAVQIPVGVLADTVGPRRTIPLFMILAALGTLMFAQAASYQVALIGRALIGLGTGVVYVSGLKANSQWFREERYATVNSVLVMVGNVGSILAGAPLAFMVGAMGWRTSFTLLSAWAGFAAVLVFLIVPRGRRKTNKPVQTPPAPKHNFKIVARQVLMNRNLWLMSLYLFMFQGAMTTFQGLWGVPYLIDVYGLSRQNASNILTLWPIGIVVGAPLCGYLTDQILKNRKIVIVSGASLFCLIFGLLVFKISGIPLWGLGIMFLCCGLLGSTNPISVALLNRTVAPEATGTALGLYNMWFFAGAAVYQIVTGAALSGYNTPGGQISSDGYVIVFALCLAGTVIASCAAFAVREPATSVRSRLGMP